MKNTIISCFVLLIIFSTNTLLNARENNGLSNGQTIYVPAYSHIYTGNKEAPSPLTVTLSIRNTDLNHPIKILSVEYYETQGKLLNKYIASPIVLNALGTERYVIPHKDKTKRSSGSS